MQMKKSIFVFLFAFVMAVGAAAQTKIATISMQQCFEGYYKSQEFQEQRVRITERFEREARERQSQLQGEAEPLQLRIQEIQENPGLSEDARQQQLIAMQPELTAFRQKEEEFQQWVQQRQQELGAQAQNMRATLLEDIRKVAMSVGIREGASIVLDSSNVDGLPAVVYADPGTDITNKVLNEINRDRPAAASGE